jgi:hypothetical protein
MGLLAACGASSGKKQVTAYITERKSMAGGKLLMKYHFQHENRLIQDSVETNNQVIPQDSLLVSFSPENPADNELQLP